MRNRMTLASVSIVVVIVAASSVSVQPGSAQTTAQAKAKADECMARPGASAPKGSHWYYRIERPSGRRCWYLGAVGQKVRAERAARIERVVPIPSPAPAELRPDDQARIEPPAATAATAPTTANAVAVTQFSAAWPVAPRADANGAHEVPTFGSQDDTRDNTEATAATTVEAQAQELPPVISAVDRAAAQPSEPAPGVLHLVIFLSAVAAFVAIAFRAVLKLAAMGRGQRNRRPAPRPAGPIIRQRAPELRAAEPSIESMSEPAIARLREIASRWDAPARAPRQPRLTAFEVEPDYAAEGAALRRRQQRVA